MPQSPAALRDQGARTSPRLFLIFAMLAAPIADSRVAVAQDEEALRPNIVILLADDLGYGELGCQGNPQIPTPHIDSIASSGVRCTSAYVTAPNCSPSRAGLLTGRIPTRFGYEFNPIGAGNDEPQAGLPPTERTLAEALHAAGYATGLVGKWHLGGSSPYHPLRHGFDEFFGFLHEGHFYKPPPYEGLTSMLRRRALPRRGEGRWTQGRLTYSTHMGHDEPPYDANNPILRGGQPVNESLYLTDAWTREAVAFIRRRHRQPFFLLVAYNAVHSPLQASDQYVARFPEIDDLHRRIFAGMLANLDESVGEILTALRETEVERRTLVVFLSDNGGPTRELTSSNRPLRGEKGQMYEGGLRVPFLLQWPDHIPRGRVCSAPISSMDIFPTAMDVAGGEPGANLDGKNLWPHLKRPDAVPPLHDAFFWRQGRRAALRRGDWKIVGQRRPDGQQQDWELYHLAADLSESRDLASSEPGKLRELQQLWLDLNGQMRAPLFE